MKIKRENTGSLCVQNWLLKRLWMITSDRLLDVVVDDDDDDDDVWGLSLFIYLHVLIYIRCC
jgi:hypothetical protein